VMRRERGIEGLPSAVSSVAMKEPSGSIAFEIHNERLSMDFTSSPCLFSLLESVRQLLRMRRFSNSSYYMKSATCFLKISDDKLYVSALARLGRDEIIVEL
jgi:hypothetical protein